VGAFSFGESMDTENPPELLLRASTPKTATHWFVRAVYWWLTFPHSDGVVSICIDAANRQALVRTRK
jgi:hypothetical protein